MILYEEFGILVVMLVFGLLVVMFGLWVGYIFVSVFVIFVFVCSLFFVYDGLINFVVGLMKFKYE